MYGETIVPGTVIPFDAFAREFVRAYWETVKSNAFPMPPDEPVEETLEELLAAVSYQTRIDSSSARAEPLHKIHMTGELGDWWEFHFLKAMSGWRLVASIVSSLDPENPDDLLSPGYAPYFKPFLQHVTNVTNERSRA